MGAVSRYLYEIEQALKQRGYVPQYSLRDVPSLRSEFPGLSAKHPNLGKSFSALIEVLEQVPTADLDEWRSPPPRKPPTQQSRKSLLSNEEIRARRSAGETYASIAEKADISRNRVMQICAATPQKE